MRTVDRHPFDQETGINGICGRQKLTTGQQPGFTRVAAVINPPQIAASGQLEPDHAVRSILRVSMRAIEHTELVVTFIPYPAAKHAVMLANAARFELPGQCAQKTARRQHDEFESGEVIAFTVQLHICHKIEVAAELTHKARCRFAAAPEVMSIRNGYLKSIRVW